MKSSVKSRLELPPGHDAGPLTPVLDWFNPSYGPITAMSWLKHGHPEPGWWIYRCDVGRPNGKFFSSYSISTSGVSLHGSQALIRALGEAVERYCGMNSLSYSETKLIRAGDNPIVAQLPTCAFDEKSPEAMKRLPDDTLLTHGRVLKLTDDSEHWMPAAYIHLSFMPEDPEPCICLPISTGLSFHGDTETAIWTGLCEAVERDSLMSFWWKRTPIPRIKMDSADLPLELAERLYRIRECGITPYLFDMSSDVRIPSVYCMLVSDERPYYVIANSTDDDPVTACTAALDEAMGIRSYQVREGIHLSVPSFENFEWIETFEDHATLYSAWRDCPAFDFLLNDPKEVTFSEFCNSDWWDAPTTMDDLREYARKMELLGLDVYYTDVTSDDVLELGRCVRVVVPQMIPMSVYDTIRWLGCERLQAEGSTREPSLRDFNPYPQPFV